MSDISTEECDNEAQQSWRGSSMEAIHRNLNAFELEHVPAVRPSDTHAVLYHVPIRTAENEPPRPLRGQHKWDANHVRLPSSTKSQYPVTADDGSVSIESRWEIVEKSLLRPIANSRELEQAILSYNTRYKDQWNFTALHKLFEEELDETEAQVFFEDLLPRIVRLALRLPQLIQTAIPLLKQGQSHSITLSQEQISCLLANAFLCTFPRRNSLKRKSEYSTFPEINFNRLFQSQGHSVLEKIKCICHYFRRVCATERDSKNVPTGAVTFTRRSMRYSELPNWSECRAPLGDIPLHITCEGTIEDQGLGLLQVDFANKFLGGGVLGGGCVQEEIRFVICPELLVSKLFTECLRPTEALIMVGSERYSNYTGYAGSFEWASNHEDETPRDSSRRRMTHIVAIDALAFVESSHQFNEKLMLRELNKAYVGFYHPLDTPAPGVASGNWGCGAFRGEAKLKALLQLMVCAATGRPLVYYTFGSSELRDAVNSMHEHFRQKNIRVNELWATLKKFEAQKLAPQELYEFILKNLEKLKSPTKTPSHKVVEPSSRRMKPIVKTSEVAKAAVVVNSTSFHKGAACTTKSATNSPSKTANGKNTSQDVFASSSESDEAAEQPISVCSTNSQTPGRIAISDDSETDVMLAAVTAEEEEAEKRVVPVASNSPTTPRTEPRQRTLLEMLDRCYSAGNTAKRTRHNDI